MKTLHCENMVNCRREVFPEKAPFRKTRCLPLNLLWFLGKIGHRNRQFVMNGEKFPRNLLTFRAALRLSFRSGGGSADSAGVRCRTFIRVHSLTTSPFTGEIPGDSPVNFRSPQPASTPALVNKPRNMKFYNQIIINFIPINSDTHRDWKKINSN